MLVRPTLFSDVGCGVVWPDLQGHKTVVAGLTLRKDMLIDVFACPISWE